MQFLVISHICYLEQEISLPQGNSILFAVQSKSMASLSGLYLIATTGPVLKLSVSESSKASSYIGSVLWYYGIFECSTHRLKESGKKIQCCGKHFFLPEKNWFKILISFQGNPSCVGEVGMSTVPWAEAIYHTLNITHQNRQIQCNTRSALHIRPIILNHFSMVRHMEMRGYIARTPPKFSQEGKWCGTKQDKP